jgi:hypothetical protein
MSNESLNLKYVKMMPQQWTIKQMNSSVANSKIIKVIDVFILYTHTTSIY